MVSFMVCELYLRKNKEMYEIKWKCSPMKLREKKK